MNGQIQTNVRTVNNKTGDVKLTGLSYETTAQALEDMTQEEQAQLYTQGYRTIIATYNDTITTHALKEDGSLVWIGCNQDTTNMLDNTDFVNPINQRGKQSYTGNGYTVDRWKNFNSADKTVTVSDAGVTLQSGMQDWGQIFLNDNLDKGAYYTFFIETAGGVISCATMQCPNSFNQEVRQYFDFQKSGLILNWLFAWTTETSLVALVVGNADVTLKRVALYKGSYTTKILPPWVAPDPAAELLKCMRFYQKSAGPFTIAASYDGVKRVIENIQLFPMRLIPTISVNVVAPSGVTLDFGYTTISNFRVRSTFKDPVDFNWEACADL